MTVPLPPQREHGWEIENRPWPWDSTPAALAARADLRRGARLRARAVARRAGRRRGHRERDLRAVDRLLEGDRDLGLEVAAALGPRRPRATAGRRHAAAGRAAEQVGQDVAEAARSKPRPKPPAPPGPPAAERAGAAVVLLALVGVAEDVVGLPDLLEALLGLRVLRVAVGVVLARELAVGLLDLARRSPSCRPRAPCRGPVAAMTCLLRGDDDPGGAQDRLAVGGSRAGRPRRRCRTRRPRRAAGPSPRAGWVEALALGRVRLDAHARERADSSACTSRMPSVRWWSAFSALRSAAASARSRLSSAGSSSRASRATPRASAAATSRARACGSSRSPPACAARARGTRRARAAGSAARRCLRDGRRRPRVAAAAPPPARASGRCVRRSPARSATPRLRLLDRRRRVVSLGHDDLPSSTTSASTTSSSRRRPRRRAVRAAAPSPSAAACCCWALLVHRLGDRVERGLQRLGLGVDLGSRPRTRAPRAPP